MCDKAAYSVSFLLSINIFVWQNVLYFLDAPRKYSLWPKVGNSECTFIRQITIAVSQGPVLCGLGAPLSKSYCDTWRLNYL